MTPTMLGYRLSDIGLRSDVILNVYLGYMLFQNHVTEIGCYDIYK
jgi:hypothetical protein